MSLAPRALLGALVAPALALPALVGVAAPARADAPVDPAPVADGAAWLAGQLTGGLMHNPTFGGFDDYGLSVDAGFALNEAGDHPSVQTISAAVAAHIDEYYTYGVFGPAPDYDVVGSHVSAGSLAKAAVFATTAGDDPASYGGEDLPSLLEDRVSTAPASEGRIGDVVIAGGEYPDSDYANTIGQSFAVRALDTADSTLTDAATDYLLAQQCAAGYFRLELGATSADTCDADAGEASVDVTAQVVLNLQSQTDDADIATVVSDAADWLIAAQSRDGSFGSDGQITTSNANSTGLAGWALGATGHPKAAERAAVWLRAHQADDIAPCTTGLSAQTGAVAYDDDALAAGRRGGITDDTSDQFRRATAQALPALQYAPLGGTPSVSPTPTGYSHAGTKKKITATGLAPGQTVCFARAKAKVLKSAGTGGRAVATVKLAAGTGVRTFNVRTSFGLIGQVDFDVLGKTKLKVVKAKKKVRRGGTQKVIVTGLASGEKVTVHLAGKKVAAGKAGKRGRFVAKLKIKKGAKIGKAKVAVRGQFGDRSGTATFKIVKR